jgi:hypothetical protein
LRASFSSKEKMKRLERREEDKMFTIQDLPTKIVGIVERLVISFTGAQSFIEQKIDQKRN